MQEGSLQVCIENALPPVVRASGELDHDNCAEFESILHDAFDTGHNAVVLALDDLSFVDSSGIRVLIKAAADAHKVGSELRISSMTPHLDHVLTISGFKDLFAIGGVTERRPEATKVATAHEYCFEAPRITGVCSHVRHRVYGFAQKMGFDTVALDDIRLAVGEAVSNAVRHGVDCDESISVRCRNHAGNLAVTLRYPSAEFDPSAIPVPTYASAPEGGMGIYFMKLVMDRVHYEFKDGCTILTLEKSLAPAPTMM